MELPTIKYYQEDTELSGALTNAGTYTAKITEGTATAKVDLEITQKPVTVTALDVSKDYNTADPELEAEVKGTVGGETVAYTLKRTEGENAGAYTIIASGAQSQGNYAVSFVSGTFTINPGKDMEAKTDTTALTKIREAYQEKNPGAVVTVAMQISDKNVSLTDTAKIQEKVGLKKLLTFDVSLLVKVGEDDVKTAGDTNDQLVKITYTFDFSKKANLQTFRVHGGIVDELTETANAKGEFVKYDKEAGIITVTACQYSTYGFAYDEVSDSPNIGITSDSAVLPAVVGLIALAVVLTFVVIRRRSVKK